MREIAALGYPVVVPEMPITMAAFSPGIASEIIASYPGIDHCVMGGHSVGGAMAAQYTGNHAETIEGVVIWASCPPNSIDHSDLDIPVVSIYGSRELRVNDASVGGAGTCFPAIPGMTALRAAIIISLDPAGLTLMTIGPPSAANHSRSKSSPQPCRYWRQSQTPPLSDGSLQPSEPTLCLDI